MSDGKVVIDILLEDGQVAKGVANVSEKLKGMSNSANTSALSIGKIVTALGLVGLANKAIGMVKGSMDRAFARIDTFERFERVMTTLTGSAEETKKALDKTNEIVTGTAYGLDAAASAVQNFVTRGLEVDKATRYIEAFGDAVAFYGDGSNEQFDRVNEAMAKMVSSGKVGGDELNTMFAAGIDAVGMYAKATGKSVESVRKDLSSGKISAEAFLDVVSEGMMEGTNGITKIAGAAKEAGASWGSVFGNMRTAVARGVASIITSIDEMLKDQGLPDMRSLVARFGKEFENVLKKVAEGLPKAIDKIIEVKNQLEPWMPLIKNAALVVGTFIAAFATMNTVVGILNNLRLAILTVNAALLANPISLIVAAIAALVAGGYLLIKNWDVIKEKALETFPGLEPIVTKLETIFGSLKEKVGVAIQGVIGIWERLPEIWAAVVGKIKGFLENFAPLIDNFKESFSRLRSHIVPAIGKIGDIFMGLWPIIKLAFDLIKVAVVAAFGVIVTAINIVIAVFGPLINAVLAFVSFIVNVVSAIISLFRGDFVGAFEYWMTAGKAAIDFFVGIFEAIMVFIDKFVTTIVDFFYGLYMTLVGGSIIPDMVNEIFGWFVNMVTWVVDLVKGFVNGIKRGFEKIAEFVTLYTNMAWEIIQSIWKYIENTFKNVLKFISALVKGDFKGMKEAIDDQMSNIKELISNIWNAIDKFVGEILGNIWTAVKDKFKEMFKAVKDTMTDVKTTIEDLWGQAKEFLLSIDLMQIGKDIINGLISGIKSKVTDVRNAVADIGNGIKNKITSIFQVKSPSRWMEKMIGHNMIYGWIKGINDKRSAVLGKAEDMAGWMIPNPRKVGAFIDNLRKSPLTIGNVVPNNAVASGTTTTTKQKEDNNLDKLVSTVKDLATRPVVLKINGRQFAYATVDDIDAVSKLKSDRARRSKGV